MTTVLTPGIDVSNWQGDVDWATVAASGIEFGIVKSSEGTTYRDPYFRGNWSGMKAANMVRGCYHYAQPDLNSPEAEAAFWLGNVEAVGGLLPGDLLALDMECGYGNLLPWTQQCLRVVAESVGFKPLLYSGAWFMNPHGLTNDAFLAEHGLWLASYGSPPVVPPQWPVLAIWQFTCEGHVPGVAGPCDVNVYNGPLETLRLYGKPGADVPPPSGGGGGGGPTTITNDDVIQTERYLLELPPNVTSAIDYLKQFLARLRGRRSAILV
jgi:lysozyme